MGRMIPLLLAAFFFMSSGLQAEDASRNSTAEDEAARELAAIQGIWIRTVTTD